MALPYGNAILIYAELCAFGIIYSTPRTQVSDLLFFLSQIKQACRV